MSIREVCSAKHSTEIVNSCVWCINWLHNGRILASCGSDKTVKIWEFNGENELVKVATISGDHSRTVRYVEFSKSGQYLACASFDATIIIYERKGVDFEEVHKLEGHENEIKCCGFSASDEFLASCSRDKTVWVWQVEDDDYEVGSILQNHTADVKFIVWHPYENNFVSGGYDCSLRFYYYDGDDWVTQQSILDAHDDTIWYGAFNSNGEYFATCGADSCIKVWRKKSFNDLDDKKWSKVIEYKVEKTNWPLYSISWNSFNDYIAVGGGDCILRILRFDDENAALTTITTIRVESEINSVKWNPSFPNLVATACDNGNITIINIHE